MTYFLDVLAAIVIVWFLAMTYDAISSARPLAALLGLALTMAMALIARLRSAAIVLVRDVLQEMSIEALVLVLVLCFVLWILAVWKWPPFYGRRQLQAGRIGCERFEGWLAEHRRDIACVTAFAPIHAALYLVASFLRLLIRSLCRWWNRAYDGVWKEKMRQAIPRSVDRMPGPGGTK